MIRMPKPLHTRAIVSSLLLGSVVSPACAQSPYVTYAPLYAGPYGGYMYGAAAVINAQGRFQVETQQAYAMYTEDQRARIRLRRERIEQWLWERDNLPTAEDNRRRYLVQQYERASYNPPLTEVWSGKSLNDLLDQAQLLRNNPQVDPPLDEALVEKINVTSGKAGGNVGLLRGGKVRWPLLLLRSTFAEGREHLELLVAQAYKQAEQQNQIDPGVLSDMIRQVDNLQKKLLNLAMSLGDKATWTPTEYVDAKNFLSQFHDALRALQQTDGVEFFTGKIRAKGKTVSELIRYMKEQGLRFAPATGNERAYKAVHSAMVDYFGHEIVTRDRGQR